MKLTNYFARTYDRRRIDANSCEYDDRRGFRAYHRYCCNFVCKRAQFQSHNAPHQFNGLEILAEHLTPEVANSLLEGAQRGRDIEQLKSNARDLHGYRWREPEAISRALETVLSARVDSLAKSFFGCEYLVHWMTLSATPPSTRPASISFRWHCDKGPREHLKLLLYLNEAQAHGGGTAFLDPAASAAVAATGYLFGPAKKRTADLDTLARRAHRSLHPIELYPNCGDAVLFQPSTVVHSGITPHCGTRFVLTACLLPSPLPWREALRCGTLSDLMEDELWPSEAAGLLHKMLPKASLTKITHR